MTAVQEALECLLPEECKQYPEEARQAAQELYQMVTGQRNRPHFRQLIRQFERSNLLDTWRRLHDAVQDESNQASDLFLYWHVFYVLWNLTDLSTTVCKAAVDKQVVESYLERLRQPECLESVKLHGSENHDYVTGYVGTLVNMSERCVDMIRPHFVKLNGIETVAPYLRAQTVAIRVRAIMLISNYVDDSNRKVLSDELTGHDAAHFLSILSSAINSADHLTTEHNLRALETLNAITRLAASSENFASSLISRGFLHRATDLLDAPNNLDDAIEQHGNSLYSKSSEKAALLNVLLALQRHSVGQSALANDSDLLQCLTSIQRDSTSTRLHQLATSILAQSMPEVDVGMS